MTGKKKKEAKLKKSPSPPQLLSEDETPETPKTVVPRSSKSANEVENVKARFRAEMEVAEAALQVAKQADSSSPPETKQCLHASLERKMKRALATADKLANLVPIEEYADLISTTDRLEDQALPVLISLAKAETSSPSRSHTSESSTHGGGVSQLPRINLPTFEGEVRRYRRFIERFKGLVLDRDDISDTLKIVHLLNCLQGSVEEAYGNVEPIGANLEGLLKALEDQYGDPFALLIMEVDTLSNLPAPTSDTDTTSLRFLANGFESGLREVRNLQRCLISTEESERTKSVNAALTASDLFVCALLIGKLPENMAADWQREKEGDQRFQLDSLIAWMKKEVAIKEAHARRATGNPPSLPAITFAVKATDTTQQLRQNPGDDFRNKARNKMCKACKTAPWHRFVACPTFMGQDVKGRIEILRMGGHCLNCFSTGHSTSNCSPPRCCGSHHPLICQEAAQVPPIATTARTSASFTGSGKVILEVVNITIRTPSGRSARLRALLDPASEVSYLRDDIAEKLRLQSLKQADFQTIVFGGGSHVENRKRVAVRADTEAGNANIPLFFWTATKITTPLEPIRVPPHARPYAEDYFNKGAARPVEALIGMDQYRLVVQDTAERLSPHLVVLNTVFGPILSGTNLGSARNAPIARTNRVSSVPVETFWSLEVAGIKPQELIEDMPTPYFAENRVVVQLPWKNDLRPTGNLAAVNGRQRKMETSLSPADRKEYDGYLREWEAQDVIKKIDTESTADQYFLPHRGERRNGKLRAVFDGGAKCGSSSTGINGLLHTGKNLITDLVQVLTKFRVRRHPALSDIKKAFLQLSLTPDDARYLRFKWRGETYQFQRLPFGLNAAPHLLCSSILILLESMADRFPDTIRALEGSIYVDDIVLSVDSPADLKRIIHETEVIFRAASMDLKPWVSIPPSPEELDCHKVLGVLWNRSSDTFSMEVLPTPPDIVGLTRRKLLASISATFDPLGCVSPWTLKGRMLCQTAWTTKRGWDSPLPLWLVEAVTAWRAASLLLPPVTIPRFTGPLDGADLHVFTDASKDAYAAAVYIRTHNGSMTLLIARARLAPLQPTMSIPRLELMGALIGARLLKLIQQTDPSLRLLKATCWTDSECTRAWIRSDAGSLKRFESNRIQEIQSITGRAWKRVPTAMNPADLATRPQQDFTYLNFWVHGPDMAALEALGDSEPSLDDNVSVATLAAHAIELPLPGPPLLPMFSTMTKTSRVTALVLHAAKCFMSRGSAKKLKRVGTHIVIPKRLISEASDAILRQEQATHNFEDLLRLRRSDLVKQSSKIAFLKPFYCETRRLIMTTPRFSSGPHLPFLPSGGQLFQLIVDDAHVRVHHAGPSSTTAEICRHFCLSRSKTAVNKVIKNCGPCLRHVHPAFNPRESGLPDWRVQPSPAFSHTGVDHIGPLRRGSSKVYVLLATCAVTRAIHLELQPSLSMEDTSRALRRFFARRGVPQKIISDNFPSFIGLSEMVEEWEFIPPRASWMGGFYERLVGLVKRCLKTTLGLTHISNDELQTVLAEVEESINRRPITADSEHPLTPAHFLSPALPLPWEQHAPCAEGFERAWRHRIKLSEDTWRRFLREYLPTLRQWRTPQAGSRDLPRTGELVLVASTPLPRMRWPLARVDRVHPHHCDLTLNGRPTRRAHRHLYRLEAAPIEDFSDMPILEPYV